MPIRFPTFKRKLILACYFSFFFIFIPTCYYLTNTLTNETKTRKRNTQLRTETFKTNPLEEAIRNNVKNLSMKYRTANSDYDSVVETFIENVQTVQKISNYRHVWNQMNGGIRENKLYQPTSNYLGTVLNSLRSAKILFADVDRRGTQLKLFLTLEGEAAAVFKPQRHSIEKIINGSIYAGEDRFNSEIFAFYLAGFLDFRSATPTVDRIINLRDDVYPVATQRLRDTIFERNGNWCVYGMCFYCAPTMAACSQSDKGLRGALMYHIPRKLNRHRSPWRRKYKENKFMRWQLQNDYCDLIRKKISKTELLDLIDTSVFDFLMQNGDRHDYETIKNRIVLLDNGKGLGNPLIHQLDILAPLYQCCMLRTSTWMRLLALAGANFRQNMERILEKKPLIINDSHLNAIEERLLLVYSTVELCQSRFPKINIFV